MWIGVLSGTQSGMHPEVVNAFQGMDYIIHCGDIGDFETLNELSQISPVTGVVGPADERDEFPFEEALSKDEWGVPIYVTYDVGTPTEPNEIVAECLTRENPKVVMFAGQGEPFNMAMDDRLWFSPGVASLNGGVDRPSVGIIEIEGTAVRGEIIYLDEDLGK